MSYSSTDIAQWLLGAFRVSAVRGPELQFPCPECDHSSCYFNVDKQVGYCHRATCRTTFTMNKMIDLIGYPPELSGYVAYSEKATITVLTPVTLPTTAKLITANDDAVIALGTRGVTWPRIQQFKIHQDESRFYVPVYEGGVLVQYNSRRIDKSKPPEKWFDAGPKPYKYCPGHPITHYFLGWDECKLWDDLVLVENTLVSMWLRDLNCTATFGSHLSDTHIDKILHSKVKHVTFLWDEGTEYASEKAQRKLKLLGIPSCIVTIKGQPDDYAKSDIQEMIG